MSTRYEMRITVENVAPGFREAVMDACAEVWDFYTEDFRENPCAPNTLYATAQGRLNAGARVQDVCDQMAVAIWRAAGHYCPVSVSMTCLEDGYVFDESQYRRLMKDALDAAESTP